MSEQPVSATERSLGSRIDDISPSDAVSIEGIPGAGRLRTEDTGAIRADWMVFDPQKLIRLLEEYHEDEAVMITTTRRELQAGPEAGLLYIGDVASEDETLSVLGEIVTGEDSKRLVKWRHRAPEGSADDAGDLDD